jgi:hypothetical protein
VHQWKGVLTVTLPKSEEAQKAGKGGKGHRQSRPIYPLLDIMQCPMWGIFDRLTMSARCPLL